MTTSSWLPGLVLLSDHEGNWDKYLSAIYNCFVADFINSTAIFRGVVVRIKRHPLTMEKEATFWHLISEGRAEEDRTPDIRRCERIRWPKSLITFSRDNSIKCWENVRRGEPRLCLWLEGEEYLLVLARRKGYLLLWTAYLVQREHTKQKLRKEYESQGPLKS